MTRAEVDQLDHGLYVLTWKSGGFSLAAVGSLHDGTRWFAATNWTSPSEAGIACTDWQEVIKATRVVSRTRSSFTLQLGDEFPKEEKKP